MKISKKFLCWVLLLIMLCAVSYGGCGGSSGDVDSDEAVQETPQENPLTPDNPNTPPEQEQSAPSPENPDGNGGTASIEGRWEITSSISSMDAPGYDNTNTFYYTGTSAPFNISLEHKEGNRYIITLSGGGVYVEDGLAKIMVYADNSMGRWDAVAGGSDFELTDANTYRIIEQGINDDGVNYTDTSTFKLIDSSTLTYYDEATGDDGTKVAMETILKRAD